MKLAPNVGVISLFFPHSFVVGFTEKAVRTPHFERAAIQKMQIGAVFPS
ncbi:hypothetical protein IWX88_002202 [Frigoribacterium sp. CG_9.8]|nr:hypothetical protein [Frigoribacterium sp. CG_9.8]